ncbi:Ubiquinone biosynthesis O-methyltransferase, mitochondrial [Streptomyces hirsutus]
MTGETSGEDYAARFAALARSGKEVHGEARFCAALVPAGARVLDAGCGTGRVMIRLAELGYDCVGVDLDASMLAVAQQQAPELPKNGSRPMLAGFEPDLLGIAADFDLVVAAGNVFPLLAVGTEATVVKRLAAALRPGGLMVAGLLCRCRPPCCGRRAWGNAKRSAGCCMNPPWHTTRTLTIPRKSDCGRQIFRLEMFSMR